MIARAPRRALKVDGQVPTTLERNNLITPEGYQKLKSERDELVKKERPRIVEEVRQAVLQGDRSENAEYLYGKKRLREIDRRVRFLNRRLDMARVIDPREQNPDCVRFGATVIVEDEKGTQRTYIIVGEDEIDLAARKISWKSPMGSGLLKAHRGDEIEIETPRGAILLIVVDYHYGEFVAG
ncbi:MAG: transcription elongation factor GreB [Betaproteobacteria bacterium]|nr:transcription elongation factor GreB [Betaproteobacteria bacterium]